MPRKRISICLHDVENWKVWNWNAKKSHSLNWIGEKLHVYSISVGGKWSKLLAGHDVYAKRALKHSPMSRAQPRCLCLPWDKHLSVAVPFAQNTSSFVFYLFPLSFYIILHYLIHIYYIMLYCIVLALYYINVV